jgi:GntR family transcriptional regulator, transcriptional repressor for pyruvate dehydrogenase complex
VADDEGMLGTGRWASFFLPTDLDHVYMLFEFRRAQEMETSRLAARRATPAELGAIEEAAGVCRHGFETGREDLFNEGDDTFHTAIATASHNMFIQIAVREARRLQAQSSLIGLRGLGGRARRQGRRGARRHLPGHPRRRPRSGRPGRRHAHRQTLADYRREIKQRLFSSSH